MSSSLDDKRPSSVVSSPNIVVPKLDSRVLEELRAEEDAHVGVKAAEASEKVYDKYSKWFLFLGLALASYIYSLDTQTTTNYLAYAASDLDKHSLISTILVAQSTVIACGNPVIAKFSDVRSRAQAYLVVLTFYVVGYVVIASAVTFNALAAGLIVYAVGNTGLTLLTSIVVADITTLKWRGFTTAMTSLPFVVNAFVGSNIASQVYIRSGWRWGYGMFAVLVPAALAPLIITLTWAERKAKKLGLIPAAKSRPELASGTSLGGKAHARVVAPAWTFAQQLDLIGLILIGTSVALTLLPLTLAQGAKGGWKNPSMIAMLVIGVLLMPFVALWEVYVAKRPFLARRLLKNRTVMLCAWMSFFDFFGATVSQTYLYSYITIVKDWSLVDINYFNQAQTVALTVFGIAGGVAMRLTRGYKNLLILGSAIRLLGVGLMIHTRGTHSNDGEIVMTQLLQGIGGGFGTLAITIAAQASVPHADIAVTTAILILWSEVGAAVGAAVAGAIWTNEMPVKLAEHLPGANATEIATLFSSIADVAAYPFGDPTREGAIAAYGDVMKLMLIAATVLTVVPLVLAFWTPNAYLGDQQNAVEATDLKGERIGDAEKSEVTV